MVAFGGRVLDSELFVGSELLGYRVEAVLGRGGMSVVYLAEDLRLRRRVALKLLSPTLAEDEAFRGRFLEESELAASLDHPGVVPVYAAGEANGRLFIAMRYVEGRDLKELLREGPLSPERTIEVCGQVAEALDFAHERGLVHRDVKPSNVLLDAREHVYLADFGLTKRLAEPRGAEPRGAEPGLFGTIDYIAPEQIRGEEVDGRADVYSLGCLLYECLTGGPPFPRVSDAAVLFAHLEEESPCPPGLEEVMPKALAKSPEDRYQRGRDLVDATRSGLGIAESSHTRWPLVLAVIGVALIGAALLTVFLLRGGAGGPTTAGRLMAIDPATSKVAATARVGAEPSAVAAGAGRVWVTTLADDGLWLIDPKTLGVQRLGANGYPVGVAISGGTAFVAADSAPYGPDVGSVTPVDAKSGNALDAIPTAGASAIAGGPDVWLVHGGRWVGSLAGEQNPFGELLRVGASEATGTLSRNSRTFGTRILQRIPIPGPPANEENSGDAVGLAIGAGGIWVLGDALTRILWRIDPAGGHIKAKVRLPFVPRSVAAGAGAMWVTAQLDDFVARIDPATGRIVARIKVGREPSGVAVGDGSVWVADTIDRTVTRIDPRSDRVVATIPVAASPAVIAVGEGAVWVAGDAS
jgi:predicted Ser/Thr protein kinase